MAKPTANSILKRLRGRGTPPARSALPEALPKRGDGWIVHPEPLPTNGGQPRTDVGRRTMWAPTDSVCESCGEDHGRMIRAHETIHAAISPPDKSKAAPEGIGTEYLDVAEELRVHRTMSGVGMTDAMAESGECESSINDWVSDVMEKAMDEDRHIPKPEKLERILALQLIAKDGIGDGAILERECERWADSSIEADSAIDFARSLLFDCRQMMQSAEAKARRGRKRKDGTLPAYKAPRYEKSTVPVAEYLQSMLEIPKQEAEDGTGYMAKQARRIPELESNRRHAGWGDMREARSPMPRRYRGRSARKTRPADWGTVPRYIERYATDGSIFGAKRPAQGGTVLIDRSGSMSLTPSEVLAIIEAAPGATVAQYVGTSGDDGVLVLSALKGKRATDKEIAGPESFKGPMVGGNIIDGPALDWLASQPEPRLWVSDGGVSGKGETQNRVLLSEAVSKVRRGRIVRVDRAPEAAELLRGVSEAMARAR